MSINMAQERIQLLAMKFIKPRSALYIAACICIGAVHGAGDAYAKEPATLNIVTTATVKNSGLLTALTPAFQEKAGLRVHVIAASADKTLARAEKGDVDLVIVESSIAEKTFLKSGSWKKHRKFMYSDFVLLGSESDPIKVAFEKTATAALSKIAAEQAIFISRGDGSPTHKKEKEIWAQAGHKPSGNWYVSTGQAMSAVLMIASEKQAYTFADRQTFAALAKNLKLVILIEGDPVLRKTYSIIAANPKKYAQAKYGDAARFIKWLTSAEGQALIKGFRMHETQVFYPNPQREAPYDSNPQL